MTTLKSHFFVSDCDGALHDTRDQNWPSRPLRSNFSRTHHEMESLADVKATLRAGPYAWPGGYPMYLITSDGGALSFKSAREEFHQIAWDWMNLTASGWKVVGCEINYEDQDLRCDHSGELIECAYSE